MWINTNWLLYSVWKMVIFAITKSHKRQLLFCEYSFRYFQPFFILRTWFVIVWMRSAFKSYLYFNIWDTPSELYFKINSLSSAVEIIWFKNNMYKQNLFIIPSTKCYLVIFSWAENGIFIKFNGIHSILVYLLNFSWLFVERTSFNFQIVTVLHFECDQI